MFAAGDVDSRTAVSFLPPWNSVPACLENGRQEVTRQGQSLLPASLPVPRQGQLSSSSLGLPLATQSYVYHIHLSSMN